MEQYQTAFCCNSSAIRLTVCHAGSWQYFCNALMQTLPSRHATVLTLLQMLASCTSRPPPPSQHCVSDVTLASCTSRPPPQPALCQRCDFSLLYESHPPPSQHCVSDVTLASCTSHPPPSQHCVSDVTLASCTSRPPPSQHCVSDVTLASCSSRPPPSPTSTVSVTFLDTNQLSITANRQASPRSRCRYKHE